MERLLGDVLDGMLLENSEHFLTGAAFAIGIAHLPQARLEVCRVQSLQGGRDIPSSRFTVDDACRLQPPALAVANVDRSLFETGNLSQAAG